MQLIQRKFILNPGAEAEFLKCLDDVADDLHADQDFLNYSILCQEENKDEIILQFLLNDDAIWEDNLQLDYVQKFRQETSSLVDHVDELRHNVIQFDTH